MAEGFVEYLFTNESLDSIMGGLRVRKGNRILACGGSGDQAFAFLERDTCVKVVELNPAQLFLIETRRNLLSAGNYEGFLADCPPGLASKFYVEPGRNPQQRDHRNSYFKKRGRLNKIRKNLARLELKQGDIEEEPGQFDGIYVSNIIGYRESEDKSDAEKRLSKLAKRLNLRGRIYVTNGQLITTKIFPEDIVYDYNESEIAYFANRKTFSSNAHWDPAVYVKMIQRVFDSQIDSH